MDKENEEIKATLGEAKKVKKEDKKTETNKNKYEGKIDIGITTIINIVAGLIFVVGLLIGITLFGESVGIALGIILSSVVLSVLLMGISEIISSTHAVFFKLKKIEENINKQESK